MSLVVSCIGCMLNLYATEGSLVVSKFSGHELLRTPSQSEMIGRSSAADPRVYQKGRRQSWRLDRGMSIDGG